MRAPTPLEPLPSMQKLRRELPAVLGCVCVCVLVCDVVCGLPCVLGPVCAGSGYYHGLVPCGVFYCVLCASLVSLGVSLVCS